MRIMASEEKTSVEMATEAPTTTEAKPIDDDKMSSVEKDLQSREGFTSEIYKIEINGLPKFFSVGQAKKLFHQNKLDFHKLKPCGRGATYMFVNFKNEEDRDKAIGVLDGITVKGKKLRAFKAKPPKDPMLKVRDAERQEGTDDRPIAERIRSAVCPLASLAYEDQLKKKADEVEEIMSGLQREIKQQYRFLEKHGKSIGESDLATVQPFVPSPVLDGYRNKCEFSIGVHPETDEVTVGFRLASYKKGSTSVASVEDIPIVSDVMKATVSKFQEFVRASGLKPFDSISQTGHWKQLTVRTSRNGDVLAWAILNPGDMKPEEREKLAKDLSDHFGDSVTSLHLQFLDRREKGAPDPLVLHVSGSSTITERLFSLSFRVSPQAFFQVNTAAAEVLYSTAGDVAGLDKDSTLIDVCCGTGTIGLCLADRCKEVVGVEIIEQAVEDANRNAKENGVANAHFRAGRAEFLLTEILKEASSTTSNVVAIVDPPRAGLHPKAIHALRTSGIQKLVFISCDARAAKKNFLDLSRPTSNAFSGDPFMPRKVVPVDLFPHSKHFELVIVFERLPLKAMIE